MSPATLRRVGLGMVAAGAALSVVLIGQTLLGLDSPAPLFPLSATSSLLGASVIAGSRRRRA